MIRSLSQPHVQCSTAVADTVLPDARDDGEIARELHVRVADENSVLGQCPILSYIRDARYVQRLAKIGREEAMRPDSVPIALAPRMVPPPSAIDDIPGAF